MKEVFFNLLTNAADALKDDGLIEVVGARARESVTVKIKDNGIGIDKEHLDKIFEPFFTTKAKGTGLGLSVCRQIVTMHRGAIRIDSEPGKGTVISVELPVREKKPRRKSNGYQKSSTR